ncbi:MAG: hypothetical protein M3Z24_02225 [Chloroflexota bacterium]|nr:hypothetical protein [Chloroflexota bacterium]
MKHRVRMFSLLLLTLITLSAGTVLGIVAFLQPVSIHARSAGKVHLTGTKQQVQAHSGTNLSYHGGPVMGGTTHAYAIFWEPTGSTVSASYHSLIERYFGDIGGSKLYQNNRQYPDANGNIASNAVLAGSWVDRTNYPSNPMHDADIQNEVTHAQSMNGWTSSLGNIFFVFTAKGETICNFVGCSFSAFCAYHGYFGGNTIYAAIPYTGTQLNVCGVPSPNHDADADSTINMISHEQNEAATDPLLNAWFNAAGDEIGDPCNYSFGRLNSRGGDVVWNGHPYEMQKEWDNAKRGCVLRGP